MNITRRAGQTGKTALTNVRCGRNEHVSARQKTAGALQIIGHAGTPVHFPLERAAGRDFLKPVECFFALIEAPPNA